MRRLLHCLYATLLVVCFAARAGAEETAPPTFGHSGQWTFSVAEALGIDHSWDSLTVNGQLVALSATSLSLMIPGAAVDLFVGHGFSVGASLRLVQTSSSVAITNTNPPVASTTGPPEVDVSSTGLAVAPRIGYAARLARWVAIWPRAGISIAYSSGNQSNGGVTEPGGTTSTLVELTVEVPLVFRVTPHAALTVGPTFDRSLWTKTTITATEAGPSGTEKDTLTEIGVQAGLLVHL